MPNLAFLKSLNIDIGNVPWSADDMLGIRDMSEGDKWAMCAISNIPFLTTDQMNQLADISGIDIEILRPFQKVSVPVDLPESSLRSIIFTMGNLFTQPLGEIAKKRFGGTQDMLRTLYAPNKQVCVNNIPSEVLCLYGLNKRALVQSIYSMYTEIDNRYLEVIKELKKMTATQIARLTSNVYTPPHIEARLRAADLTLAYNLEQAPYTVEGIGGGGVAGCGMFPEITTWGGADWLDGSLAFTYKFGTLNLSARPVNPLCKINGTLKVHREPMEDPAHPGEYIPSTTIATDTGQEIGYLTRWNELPYPDIGTTYSKVDVLGNMYIGKYQDPQSVNGGTFNEETAEGTKEMATVTLETITDPGAGDTLAWRAVEVNTELPSRVHITGYASRAVLAETEKALFRDRALVDTVIWLHGLAGNPIWFAFLMDKEALTADAYLVGTCMIWLATPGIADPPGYYECGEVSVVQTLLTTPVTLATSPMRHRLLNSAPAGEVDPNGLNEITVPLAFRFDNSADTYLVVHNEDGDVRVAINVPTLPNSGYWTSTDGTLWTPILI